MLSNSEPPIRPGDVPPTFCGPVLVLCVNCSLGFLFLCCCDPSFRDALLQTSVITSVSSSSCCLPLSWRQSVHPPVTSDLSSSFTLSQTCSVNLRDAVRKIPADQQFDTLRPTTTPRSSKSPFFISLRLSLNFSVSECTELLPQYRAAEHVYLMKWQSVSCTFEMTVIFRLFVSKLK